MINNKIEFRSYSSDFKIESRKIRGLAIPVESRSQLLGGEFYETISREAVDNNLILNNDVRLLIDHEPQRGSLARSKYGEGTLRLEIDDNGLVYEFDLPNTPFGDEIYDGIRRGDIDAVSFGFYCGKDEWRKNADGTYERRILNIEKLIEISLLDIAPAYTATDVNIRSLEDFKRSLEDENNEDDKKEDNEDPNEDNEDPKEDNEDPKDDDIKEDDEDKKEDEIKALNEKLDKIKAEFDKLVNEN